MNSVGDLDKIRQNKRLRSVLLRLDELERNARDEFETLSQTDPQLGGWTDDVQMWP